MGGDHVHKAASVFAFSSGCEVCTADGKDQHLMKLKRYSCHSPWELFYIHREREGLLEKPECKVI